MPAQGRSGVAILDKPPGLTSHAVVAQARRLFGRKDLGHAGTLDPMATGVLLLLVGQACKLSSYLTADTKHYEAEISFGRSTDTLDAEGQTTEEAALDDGALTQERVLRALEAERARTSQVPPAVSAIKVEGQRAYALARRGAAPELPPLPVQVLELRLLALTPPRLRCELHVSKGYYVRALARDLGAWLGTPAHLSALRRTRSGPFSLERACPWPPSAPPSLVALSDAARSVLPVCRLVASAVPKARQGKLLSVEDFDELPMGLGPGAWLSPEGELVAVGARSGELRVLRGFSSEPPDP